MTFVEPAVVACPYLPVFNIRTHISSGTWSHNNPATLWVRKFFLNILVLLKRFQFFRFKVAMAAYPVCLNENIVDKLSIEVEN